MKTQIIILAIILQILALGGVSAVPTLDGGFFQMGPAIAGQFSDEQLGVEVGNLKAAGMDIIIIQYATAPIWSEGQEDYISYVGNSVYPVHEAFQGRAAYEAIFAAAAEHGVHVYLGGLLIEPPRNEELERKLALWTSPRAFAFRTELIEKFNQYESFAGWYLPNEPNFERFEKAGVDPAPMLEATRSVSQFLKETKPDLEIIHSIGLYLMPNESGGHQLTTPARLDGFWRPWVSSLENVDVWMVIDGVGTKLSNLEHTATMQSWARALAREYGKAYWTDVENAHMGAESYPFTIEELKQSLAVADQYAEKMVTFDYIHYMSKQSPKEKARQLYADYMEYISSEPKGELILLP